MQFEQTLKSKSKVTTSNTCSSSLLKIHKKYLIRWKITGLKQTDIFLTKLKVGLKHCGACKKWYIHIFQNALVANKYRKKIQLKELKWMSLFQFIAYGVSIYPHWLVLGGKMQMFPQSLMLPPLTQPLSSHRYLRGTRPRQGFRHCCATDTAIF